MVNFCSQHVLNSARMRFLRCRLKINVDFSLNEFIEASVCSLLKAKGIDIEILRNMVEDDLRDMGIAKVS